MHKFIAPEVHCAELIPASPVIIAHKTAKLLKFLQVHYQWEHTIGVWANVSLFILIVSLCLLTSLVCQEQATMCLWYWEIIIEVTTY